MNVLPDEVLKRYEKRKDIVAISGPDGLKQIKGFRDEALRGEWKGHQLHAKICSGKNGESRVFNRG